MEFKFAQIDASIVAAVLGVTMLIVFRVAWKIGHKTPPDSDTRATGRFIDGTVGLLTLLLGFAFAMAWTRHDYRREMVVNDSNCIGDFYSTSSMLKDPIRSQLQDVIRDYIALRLEVARESSADLFEQSLKKSEEMHGRMHALATQAVDGGTPIAVPLVNDLNKLTSAHTSRIAAARELLPIPVISLLFAAALLSTLLVAQCHSSHENPRLAASLSFIIIVALAIFVILDLNQPGKGMIKVSQEPLERLAASIAK